MFHTLTRRNPGPEEVGGVNYFVPRVFLYLGGHNYIAWDSVLRVRATLLFLVRCQYIILIVGLIICSFQHVVPETVVPAMVHTYNFMPHRVRTVS